MAQEQKSKRLKVIPWDEKTGLTNRLPIRMVKMVRPRCDTCSVQGYGWWNKCIHKPYHTFQVIDDPQARMTFNEETQEWIEDLSKAQVIRGRRLVPNIVQVPLTIRVGSGLEVEAKLQQGCKFPEDVKPLKADGEPDDAFDGYAPMCEFQNCYKANPTIAATHMTLEENRQVPPRYYHAKYCSTNHAKRAKLKDSGQVRYDDSLSGTYLGQATSKSARAQLESVVL